MEDNVALAAAEAIPGPSTSADITPTTSTTSPRSHRVYTRPSPLFTTSSSSTPSPPSLPLRSPLRPPPRSISTSTQSSSTVSHSNSAVASSNTSTLTLDSPVSPQTPTDDLASISDLTLLPAHFQMRDRHNSFPSLNGLIDPLVLVDDEKQMQRPSLLNLNLNLNGVTVDLLSKELPERPETPLSINLEDDSILESNVDNNTNTTAPTSVASSHHPPPPTMSKRHHAMHELLSSERAYASDLALIREVHIPLALGHTAMLQSVPVSPPSSGSGSSTRTVSTSSDSSTASLGPPMAPEDVKVIFSNIEELAILSDMFAEKLEFALGNVVEGGQGDDYIGALFLECVPLWERPYKQYITRHPSALQHLQNLPQTPALAAYLSYTQRVASELSHAWDLASLLIKPVQRLLKYPLLLNTIIDETADAHPDKENLRAARERIEELARNVNEGRRRAEVVKDVLTSKGGKKPSAPVGVSASVSLSKVKSLRHGGVTAATMRASALAAANGNGDGGAAGAEGGNGGGGEAAQVEAMQAELKQIEVFAQQFARNVVDWGKMMSNMMLALRTWALSFGKVIGLSADQRSEAFEAFVDVVRQKLMPLSADLEAAINERLLKDMAHLLMTMNQPLKLLASMNEQEPYHYHLLTMPVSQKNRPPASLLAASTNYLALRGQLAAELPAYLRLLHRGFQIFVLRLAGIQTRFWKDVKEHWAELWEMLRVESELNVGWEETCAVWCARWADVDEVVKALGVALPVPHVQPTPRTYYYTYQYPAASSSSVPSTATATATPPAAQTDFAEYFAYPGYYMPMTPNFSTPPPPPTTKNRRESESSGNSGSKLEKLNSKSSGHSNGNSKTSSTGGGAGAAAVTVQSMFAALEPAHSPVHKKSSISSYSTPAGASTSTTNVVSGSGPGYAPSLVTGSMFGGGASMYSVSGPLPLGSVPIPVHRDREREREKDGRKERDRDRERGRGRGASDASALPSSKNGSGSVGGSYNHSPNGNGNGNGRRPSSQDGAHIRAAATAAAGAGGGARTPPARRRTQGHGMAEEFAEYVALHGQGGIMPPPYGGAQYPYSPPAAGSGGGGRESSPSPRQGITRMKSMPLSLSQTQANGGRYVVDGERDRDRERAHYETSTPNGAEESWEDYQVHHQQQQQQQQQQYPSETTTIRQSERGRDRDRDRETETRRLTKPHRPVESSPKRKSKEHARKRSGSVKSITSFFTGAPSSTNPTSNPNAPAPPPDPQPLTASQRDSWVSKPAKYICQVIHPCKPPASVAYYSFPFFTLKEGALYEVLQEAGHPSIHPKLPLYVDDGEDCLLLCRDGNGVVGWALASFLEPLSIGG
ncbi:hypothetical protein CVT25_002261 [Psilocybe cyanescens]|uniref:DH domain-containing protein n=1 Tax=Psilocybe cyanescens TaxID=93625 RepID=A0A409WKD8_PSICY|nr:hypothetical protein CVT25_002261 [Psilocybe cyanescens]